MLCGLASVFLALGVRALAEQPPTFELVEGDSVVFIGNTFAEQMHLFGYFETFLHGKSPDHQLELATRRDQDLRLRAVGILA